MPPKRRYLRNYQPPQIKYNLKMCRKKNSPDRVNLFGTDYKGRIINLIWEIKYWN